MQTMNERNAPLQEWALPDGLMSIAGLADELGCKPQAVRDYLRRITAGYIVQAWVDTDDGDKTVCKKMVLMSTEAADQVRGKIKTPRPVREKIKHTPIHLDKSELPAGSVTALEICWKQECSSNNVLQAAKKLGISQRYGIVTRPTKKSQRVRGKLIYFSAEEAARINAAMSCTAEERESQRARMRAALEVAHSKMRDPDISEFQKTHLDVPTGYVMLIPSAWIPQAGDKIYTEHGWREVWNGDSAIGQQSKYPVARPMKKDKPRGWDMVRQAAGW